MSDDKNTQADEKEKGARRQTGSTPAAGPHARPDLTNPDATPGTGSLPDDEGGRDAEGGTG